MQDAPRARARGSPCVGAGEPPLRYNGATTTPGARVARCGASVRSTPHYTRRDYHAVLRESDVRIRYEGWLRPPAAGHPRRGLELRVSNWPTAVINAMRRLRRVRRITMDQRNANGGDPRPDPGRRPLGASADDELGPMDHLGIREFFFMATPLGARSPSTSWSGLRIASWPACSASRRHRPGSRTTCTMGATIGTRTARPAADLTMETIEAYLDLLFRVQPSFVYSVSRDFFRACQTTMLVMPTTRWDSPIRSPWTLRRWRRRPK